MAVSSVRVRRRVTGSPGAPASLKTAEIAYNMVDGIFYIGFGDDASGNATSVKAFAKDNYVDPSTLYQPLDSDLTALAALSATGGSLHRTGAGAFAVRTLTGTSGRLTVANGDGVSANPIFDLATVSVGTATSGGSTKFTVDAYGRVTNASQATLTDIAAPTADYSVGGFKLTNLGAPTSTTDAVTKQYVDALIQGLDPKQSVIAATAAALPTSTYATQTITANSNGVLTVDGITPALNDRLLIKDEAAPARNGLYYLSTLGTAGVPFVLTRVADMDVWSEIPGAYVAVETGTANGDKMYLATADAGGTLGTTAINWSLFGSGGAGFTVAGNGLTSSGVTVDVVASNGIVANANDIQLTGNALAIHNVTVAADKLIYATSGSAFAATDFTSVARTLVAQTTQALMRSAGLGLGTMSTQDASAVAITGGTIDGVTIDGGTF